MYDLYDYIAPIIKKHRLSPYIQMHNTKQILTMSATTYNLFRVYNLLDTMYSKRSPKPKILGVSVTTVDGPDITLITRLLRSKSPTTLPLVRIEENQWIEL